ncbi:MAG: Ig-like domain repeat protein [Planctomycetes bacterium]|nr:Ig-like domain repeat protein [Planctomycetota bacterium]
MAEIIYRFRNRTGKVRRRGPFRPRLETLEDRTVPTSVPMFAGNAQHTGLYTTPAQDLNAIHWQTKIDLNEVHVDIHYGTPLVTAANTVIVPVKTGPSDGFQVSAFNGADGSFKYTLATDYTLPSYDWIPSYSPSIVTGAFGTRLYYAGAGGTIYYIDNPDSDSHGDPVQLAFYGLDNYQADPASFNSTVFVNTPITADSAGDIFFGFRVQGTAPAPLNTDQSGYARIAPDGTATYVLVGDATGDPSVVLDSHDSAPALSNDDSTLYVIAKNANWFGVHLIGLDATTLATRYDVHLTDPRDPSFEAFLFDEGTASPMVAPNGDVFMGVFDNPSYGYRGFLLHFSADLSVEYAPGAFGWDTTAAIVPASMVPSYTGTSPYLIFTKYNDYALFYTDGKGLNQMVILDPNATEIDVHASNFGVPMMREVLAIAGPTPDPDHVNSTTPNAVEEWCVNAVAVNPATFSTYGPNEDGYVYRWDLRTNSFTQAISIPGGVIEAYVPTVIGPDGTIYTINGDTMYALGALSGVSVHVDSSDPDDAPVSVGQSLTFTATIADAGGFGTPTGTVTFEDEVPQPDGSEITTILAADVPLDGNGQASFTSADLGAGSHFISAIYSGDGTHPGGESTLVQRIHVSATTTTLSFLLSPGLTATLDATVVGLTPPSGQQPTGLVSFLEGNQVIGQTPINNIGEAIFTTGDLSVGDHVFTARYDSNPAFASSSGTSDFLESGFTVTTVASAPNPSIAGDLVTFTASVLGIDVGFGFPIGTPTGTVTFMEGNDVLAADVPIDLSGNASFSTAALGVGSHSILAVVNGTNGWVDISGDSASTTQVVNPLATFSINDISVTEGNTGTKNMTFTVTLSAALDHSVTVNYSTTDGSAVAPGDYLAASGTLTFTTGVISRTFTVKVVGDTLDEFNESFFVNLSNATGGTGFGDGQGAGTILDNDTAAIKIGDTSVTEGDSGTTPATFNLTLSLPADHTITVDYATGTTGTAISGIDYQATSGTATFAPGVTSVPISVPVIGDLIDEVNETFFVNLTNPTGGATINDAVGKGTIVDNDTATISINDVSGNEGNAGNTPFVFTVSLSIPSSQTVRVKYATANGTAVSGSDYTAVSSSLTFAPGETSKTITIHVKGDTAIEPDETFFVNLTSSSGAPIADNQGVGTILNDDGAALVSFLSARRGMADGNLAQQPSTAPASASRGAEAASPPRTLILDALFSSAGSKDLGSALARVPELQADNPWVLVHALPSWEELAGR